MSNATKPIDLIPSSLESRPSEPAKIFAMHLHDLHAETIRKIILNGQNYKSVASLHCRFQELQEGEMVMGVRLVKSVIKKFQAKDTGLYTIHKIMPTTIL